MDEQGWGYQGKWKSQGWSDFKGELNGAVLTVGYENHIAL